MSPQALAWENVRRRWRSMDDGEERINVQNSTIEWLGPRGAVYCVAYCCLRWKIVNVAATTPSDGTEFPFAALSACESCILQVFQLFSFCRSNEKLFSSSSKHFSSAIRVCFKFVATPISSFLQQLGNFLFASSWKIGILNFFGSFVSRPRLTGINPRLYVDRNGAMIRPNWLTMAKFSISSFGDCQLLRFFARRLHGTSQLSAASGLRERHDANATPRHTSSNYR